MQQEIKIPLVSVTRTDGDEKHTRLTYYVGEVMILDMDILKELIPSSGPIDDFMLVQLLVTPHEHMSLLGDVLSYARAQSTSGPAWEELLQRIERLILPPTPPTSLPTL